MLFHGDGEAFNVWRDTFTAPTLANPYRLANSSSTSLLTLGQISALGFASDYLLLEQHGVYSAYTLRNC